MVTMFSIARAAGYRLVHAIDSGVTPFVNDIYQSEILSPLRELALSDEELATVREILDERREARKTWKELFRNSPGAVQILPDDCEESLTVDELQYAASAIRCWVLGTAIDGFNPDFFAALADRLSTVALDRMPVSN
jgi:hypothetical protein